MSPGLRLPLVLLCFFLSGLTALVYQTAWTREFAFVFGTSELAVATVLAAYMGGLAVGSATAARFAGSIRRPILVYGLLELGVAMSALLVPTLIRAATVLYEITFSGRIDAGGLGSALFYVVASFAVLVLPTAFMGATLPLLARHAVRNDGELGSRIGLLYSVNTAGAVVGTLLAAFVLLPRIGLGATVGFAVAANAVIFVLAAVVARVAPAVPAAVRAAASPGEWNGRWILPLIFASGIASFTYEVLWTRLLGHVLGGSVYAFATMLASFLVGIAGGAAVAARWAKTPQVAGIGFAVAQVGTALLAIGAFAAADALPGVARALEGLQPWGDALVSGLFLLPFTLCIGATFPFAVRILARGEDDAGPASARVYAWNTAGAIVGAVGAGFFVVPALGFAGTFRVAALLNLALAGAAAWLVVPRARRVLWLAAGFALILVFVAPGRPWGVLRFGPLSAEAATGEVSFFAVGRSATVLVLQQAGAWRLSSNGLPEAAIHPPGYPRANARTARWLTALPLLARPAAKTMLVIGLGGGVAVERLSPGLERIDVVELEPQVVAANRALAAERALDPLRDPRLRVIENDARGALILSGDSYDLIVSQPSHPWTAGASHLYTREFFALVRERLSQDGAFLQWIGPGFVDEELMKILVATLQDVFEHVVVHQPHEAGGILLLASAAPLDPIAGTAEAIATAPEVFVALGVYLPEDVAATQLLDTEGARRFAAGAPINRDRRNHLQMRSPKLRGERKGVLSPAPLITQAGLAPSPAEGLDPLLLIARMLNLRFTTLAVAVAAELSDPVDRAVAAAMIHRRAGRRGKASAALRLALEQSPGHARARAVMFSLRGRAALREEVLPLADASAIELAVREAMAQLEESEFDAHAWTALDSRLRQVAPGEPFFQAATRLRARWRLRDGSPQARHEGLELSDMLYARSGNASDLFLRANLAVPLGEPVVVLASLEGWLTGTLPGRRTLAELASAKKWIAELPESRRWEGWRQQIGARLAQRGKKRRAR